jgi:glycosyltransferase involved in cell wall biosynthesis
MASELVSCILATRKRPQFMAQALRCFEDQTYRAKELIVVDDGEPSVRDLCMNRPRVRYIGLPKPTLLGTKLNIGIASASGNILQKFDDDDYYHPKFLETAMSHFPVRNGKSAIVAWDCFLALNAGDPCVRFSGHGWFVGATLCFSRQLWERRPFRDLPCSVDSRFVKDHRRSARLVRVCAPGYFVVVRHGRNTWKWFSNGQKVESYFRERMEAVPQPIEKIVSRRHCDFYKSLAQSGT